VLLLVKGILQFCSTSLCTSTLGWASLACQRDKALEAEVPTELTKAKVFSCALEVTD